MTETKKGRLGATVAVLGPLLALGLLSIWQFGDEAKRRTPAGAARYLFNDETAEEYARNLYEDNLEEHMDEDDEDEDEVLESLIEAWKDDLFQAEGGMPEYVLQEIAHLIIHNEEIDFIDGLKTLFKDAGSTRYLHLPDTEPESYPALHHTGIGKGRISS